MTEITLDQWEEPSDYGGFNPIGHYGVYTQHRDSDVLTRSNWQVACQRMAEAAGIDEVPELEGGWGGDPDQTPVVYQWCAGHWAVGWVEYLMVRPDAPETVLEAAQEIKDSLADYPALDEEHWSNLEYEEMFSYWAGMSVRHRAEIIRESGADVSIFAARRDELPSDNSGRLEEWL